MKDYKDLISELRTKVSRDNRKLLDEAADAIEHLQREMDEIFDEIPHICFYCKKAMSCGEIRGTCKGWEWRGA